jgi:glutamate racemase
MMRDAGESGGSGVARASGPLGVFDSGVGGLSVLREIRALLPAENILYVADTAHCPYGGRSAAEVLALCENVTRFLLARQCKLIVVACNTATGLALDALRQQHPETPFVGVEPALKPAAALTQTGTIGVLATAGTFRGRQFNETQKRFASGTRVLTVEGTGLVELVEQGMANSPQAEEVLRKHLAPLRAANADILVLGCTHYPFLEAAIRKVLAEGASGGGTGVKIVSSGAAVARRVKQVLVEQNLLAPEGGGGGGGNEGSGGNPPARIEFFDTQGATPAEFAKPSPRLQTFAAHN